MAEFTHPLAQFAQGAQSGVQMGLQIDQVRQQRRSQEWQRDLQLASQYMDFAGTKGATDTTRSEAINSANQIFQKWYPDMKFPTIAPEQMPDYTPVLKAGSDLIKTLEKDPGKFQFAISEWGRHNADWVANAGKKAALTDAQETARKQVTDTLNKMGDAQSDKEKAGKVKTPDKVLEEMFEINKTIAGMGKLDAQTAMMIGLAPDSPAAQAMAQGRVDPEMMAQIKGLGAARMETLNASLPEGQRLKAISPAEYEALVKAGHSPEEIFRKTYVVQGKSGK